MSARNYITIRFIEQFPPSLFRALLADGALANHCRDLHLVNLRESWNRIASMVPRWTHQAWIDKRTDPETRHEQVLQVFVDPYQLAVNAWARVEVIPRQPVPWRPEASPRVKGLEPEVIRVPRGWLFETREDAENHLAVQTLAGGAEREGYL